MKKNSIFLSMIGLSVMFHGLVLFGIARNDFRTRPAVSENQFVSTINIIKMGTSPQKNAPGEPREEKTIEKSVEPPSELIPVEETDYSEEVQENQEAQQRDNEEPQGEGGIGNNGEVQEDETGGGAAITDLEYEALLAYIKEFINKNLAYPPMARRRNIEGVVGVYFEIGESGEVVSVVVNHSSGSSMLDNAAVSLIKKIRPLGNIAITRKLILNVNIDYELTE
jgi:protein TonB